ncbi:hypothetical protein M9458_035727, partial [Cirrhinus mrigala]
RSVIVWSRPLRRLITFTPTVTPPPPCSCIGPDPLSPADRRSTTQSAVTRWDCRTPRWCSTCT